MPRASFDVAVVGGGIVGLATALALARRRTSVLLVEAESELATHQTGHNSGVIHSGLYYPPGSLKARLCRRGRALLLDLCAEHEVPHEVCGKLVVAGTAEEVARLDVLEERGRANGLERMRRLGPAEIAEREPHVRGLSALLVPETGIVDFAAAARAMAAEASSAGAVIEPGSALKAVDRRGDGLTLTTAGGERRCRHLVACAGLQADRVARLCGVDPGVAIVPFRGEYHRLVPERRGLVRHLVYPVPDPALPFLGVHFTRTVGGDVEIGPDAVLALGRHAYRRGEVDFRDLGAMVRHRGVRRMLWAQRRRGLAELWRSRRSGARLAAMRHLVPELGDGDVVRARSGVRAQAVAPDGRLVDDFQLVAAERSLHVLNAPSPAATASLAIGEHVADEAQRVFAPSRG